MTKPIQVKDIKIGEGLPKICVPLTGTAKEQIFEEAKKAKESGADLVEWRADFYKAFAQHEELEQLLEALSEILEEIPLLFTIRTKPEGGEAELSTEAYKELILCAARTGKAELIDVEVFGDELEKVKLVEELHKEGVIVVGSSHDFAKTDDKDMLLARFKIMDRTGADILKMAAMPKDFDDVAALMQVTNDMAVNLTEKPLITMSMGELGMMSRIAGENFGSCVTFGTVGKASAPGQIPVMDLKNMLEALHIKNSNE